MNNPTLTAGSQFTSPFDILPNVVYTNPTGINSAQFTAPFTSYLLGGFAGPSFNPTNGGSPQASAQFTAPYNILPDLILPNITTQAPSQFSAPFNILPDVSMKNPTNSNQSKLQFKRPFNILPDPIFPSPTTAKPLVDTGLVNADKLTTNSINPAARNWTAGTAVHTNVSLKTTGANALGFITLAAGSLLGIPQIGQVGQALLDTTTLSGTYTTLPLDKLTLKLFPGTEIQTPVLYPDFRSRVNIDTDSNVGAGNQALAYLTSRRLDGASALTRGSVKAGIYASAVVTPVGPYSVFNLDGTGKSGYGWGEHDHPDAIRKDFTMRSHIAKKWLPGLLGVVPNTDDADITFGYDYSGGKGEYVSTLNPVELATPFRGDKVTVIDFGKRSLKNAYKWKPGLLNNVLGLDLNINGANLTQDFIKFFFTGPKLYAGNDIDSDDIIVFRATLTNFADSFAANWTPVNMIGRADPNYIYTGFSRDLSIAFDVYATDRDEMQPIYRKLNALAGYTAPIYDPESIAMEGPWMRLTIGDLFNQTPVVLNTLSYDFGVADAPWEINIEDDPNMMQVPFKISVQCTFNVIADQLPQKGGRFYNLAKRHAFGTPLTGDDNWLSDTKGNINAAKLRKRFRTSKSKVTGKATSNDITEVTNNATDITGQGFA